MPDNKIQYKKLVNKSAYQLKHQFFPGTLYDLNMYFSNLGSVQEAKMCADQIKSVGNDRLKQGDYYDAIWKYSHALQLCLERPGLNKEAAIVQVNCALACLKLGHSLRPLLAPPQMNFWYAAAYGSRHIKM